MTNQNIAAGNLPVMDGQPTTDGIRVALFGQTDRRENGLWNVSASSAWARATDVRCPWWRRVFGF